MTASIWEVGSKEYYGDQPNSVSHSDLEIFRDSPPMYEARFLKGMWPFEQTDAMAFGHVFHSMILENLQTFTLIPDEALSAAGQKRGKAWDEFERAHDGETLFSKAQADNLYQMRDAILKHGMARAILFEMQGDNEQSIKWTDADTGLTCRCRLDALRPNDGVIADIKTSADASPKMFANAAFDRGYHRQAAFYRQAVKSLTGKTMDFVFIVIQNSPPFTVEAFELEEGFIRQGEDETRKDLRQFKVCKESGIWQREMHGQVIKISAPRWARFEKEWDLE